MSRLRFLAVPAAALLLLAACGDDDTGGTTSPAPAATAAPTSPAPDAPATTGASTAPATVALSDDGTHLVSAEGRSLYLFTSDQGTTSACGSGCLENWPPLVAASPTAGEGVDATLLSSAAGAVADQVTYNGHLLYYFAGDLVPGDANGVGIPNWYLVDPAGNAIDGS